MNQELVPDDVLPNDFVRAIKHSDYSSVSQLFFLSLYLVLTPSISTVLRN